MEDSSNIERPLDKLGRLRDQLRARLLELRREAADPTKPRATDHKPDLSGLRVLHVDDEREARAILTAFFSLERIEATATEGVHEALAKLRAETFDLVIADLGLSDGSGFASCGQSACRRSLAQRSRSSP